MRSFIIALICLVLQANLCLCKSLQQPKAGRTNNKIPIFLNADRSLHKVALLIWTRVHRNGRLI